MVCNSVRDSVDLPWVIFVEQLWQFLSFFSFSRQEMFENIWIVLKYHSTSHLYFIVIVWF